ncbi:hypothetical protein ACLKA7_008667 [Drosophila subpalustris]
MVKNAEEATNQRLQNDLCDYRVFYHLNRPLTLTLHLNLQLAESPDSLHHIIKMFTSATTHWNGERSPNDSAKPSSRDSESQSRVESQNQEF